jgi:glucose dehydrogenase
LATLRISTEFANGKTIWDEPLGEARANGPFGIPSMLPIRIGTPNNGGAVVTAGGLIFIAAATDNLIRVIDGQRSSSPVASSAGRSRFADAQALA